MICDDDSRYIVSCHAIKSVICFDLQFSRCMRPMTSFCIFIAYINRGNSFKLQNYKMRLKQIRLKYILIIHGNVVFCFVPRLREILETKIFACSFQCLCIRYIVFGTNESIILLSLISKGEKIHHTDYGALLLM
jgi:hypothetical protein